MNKKKLIVIVILTVLLIVIGCLIFVYQYLSYPKVIVNEIALCNSTMNGKRPQYNNPIIPQGFKAVNDGASWSKQQWNQGLVIQDEKGNQFVWVPVKDGVGKDCVYDSADQKVQYKKWYIYEEKDEIYENDIAYIENLIGEEITNPQLTSRDIVEDSLPNEIRIEEKQIHQYGGFYIARYEAGISYDDFNQIYSLEDGYTSYTVNALNNTSHYIPVSQKNSPIFNFIDYDNAKKSAEKMYQTSAVQSGLMTGKQFDTIMRWAQVCGYDMNHANQWGNFLDTIDVSYTNRYASYLRNQSQDWQIKDYGTKTDAKIIFTSSGGVEIAKMNQIYDIAGNVFEFTTDLYHQKIAMVRGGSAAYDGSEDSMHLVSGYSFGDSLHYVIGFRVVLYIK